MDPGPTAILYVIGIGYYTDDDQSVYEKVKSIFDDGITEHMVIIFTRGDQLRQHGKTIQKVLTTAPDNLLKTLDECGHRYVVFDNTADDKETQVTRLVQIVCKMSKARSDGPYTFHRYPQGGELDNEVSMRLRKMEATEVKSKCVQEFEEMAKQIQEEMEREKRDFERRAAEMQKRMNTAIEEGKQIMMALNKMLSDQELGAERQKKEDINMIEKMKPQREEKPLLGETLTFLMVGKTGSGKSTSGNTILGGDFFQSSAAFTSVTAECELQRSTRNGVTIEIMDCPGLFDTSKSHEALANIVVKSVGGMHPGPHAILLFVRIGRFTEEEENSYTRLMALFDERLAKYTIVVFTGGDAIRSNDSFEEMIAANRKLHSILTTCDNRYIIFNNMASNKEPQVDLLLEKVRALMAKNGGEPYTCPKYFKVAEAIEEEVKRRIANGEILKKKQYVQELETQAEQAKNDLEREKTELTEREKTRKQKEKEEEEMRREQVESLERQLVHMSEETRRQRVEALKQKLENERQKQKKEMETLRQQEKKSIRKMEEENEKMLMITKREKEELLAAIKRAKEEEMRKLKYSIANREESSLFDNLPGIGSVIKFIARKIRGQN